MASKQQPGLERYTGTTSDIPGPLVNHAARERNHSRTLAGFCMEETPPYYKLFPKTTRFHRRSMRPITAIEDGMMVTTFSITTGAREVARFNDEAFAVGTFFTICK